MSVFDRWGMELLRLEGDQPFVMGWDGTYKDQECPIGIYVYKIEIYDMKNQRYQYTGHINLLR
jgi:gliding motility-associated-like protein